MASGSALVGLCHRGARSAFAEHPISVTGGHRPVNQGPGHCLRGARSVVGTRPSPWGRSRSMWSDASLPWEAVTKHVETVTDAGASVRPSHRGGHGCRCIRASLPWGRSRMHVHGCIPPVGAVTDAGGAMHPSHGRRLRMQVQGCIPPMGGVYGCRCRDAPVPLDSGPEARRVMHPSRMRGPRCTMGSLIPAA